MHTIYLLINQNRNKTYVGFSGDLNNRMQQHKAKKVRSTQGFGKFVCFILERVVNLKQARIREKYWKSHAGRKKIKIILDKHGAII